MSTAPIGIVGFVVAIAALHSAGAQERDDAPRSRASAIENVTVVDVRSGQLLPFHSVVIRDDRIVQVGPSVAIMIPLDAMRIDGTGRFLIPGLIDMHAHPQGADFPLYVATGVTTLRAMLGNRGLLRLREEVRTGKLLGPSLVVAGPIIESPPPPGYPSIVTAGRRMIRTADEAASEVQLQVAAGFDFLKVYNHLSADAYFGLLRAARARGMDVVGHVPFAVGIAQALDSGQRTIEHGRGYLQMLLPPDVMAATGPDLRSRVLAWRDADTMKIAHAARVTAVAGAWNCPTFVVDRMLWPASRMMSFLAGSHARFLSPGRRQTLMDRTRIQWASNFSEADFEAADYTDGVKRQIVRALRDAGAPLCAGSDAWPPAGFSLHDELRELVDAGLTPLEALRAATSSAADAMRRPDLGEVVVGKRADLVLLDDNILADVEAVARIRGVMLNGRWLPKPTLDSLLEVVAASHTRSIVVADGRSGADARILRRGAAPALSRDGRTVFFLEPDPEHQKLIYRPGARDEVRRRIFLTTRLMASPRATGRGAARVIASGVIADSFEPTFDVSPDGRSVVYSGFADDSTPAIMLVSADGGAPRMLQRLGDAEGALPRWSPDGRSIAYGRRAAGLFVVPASGGAPRRLSPAVPFWDAEVRWSPDGKQIAGLGGRDSTGISTLYVVSVASGEARRVTPASEDSSAKEGIRWHPDGKRVSYMFYGGGDQVRIARADGSGTELLVDIPDQWDWYGVWSPDGMRYVFLSYGARNGLFEFDLATRATRFVSPAESLPVWSADGSEVVWSVAGDAPGRR